MERLTFPNGSRAYLDSSPIIYSVEERSDYWELLHDVWNSLETGDVEIVTSELALLETLVHPIRENSRRMFLQ